MHRLARRAGYPSDSSRADRQQPGHGRRAEARRTTATPTTDSVTSATDPAAPRPGGATRVLGPEPARVRNHRHRPRPPERARARCPTATVSGPPVLARERCPAEDYSASSGEPTSVTAPGRRSAPGPVPGRAAVRPGGPVATDCAARGGSTGLHSGLRTGRVAGLLCRPWAGRLVHGCRAVGAVPSRLRREEIAAVGRTLCVHRARREQECGPVPGLPHESSLCYGPRAAKVGPGGGPDRPKSARASPPSSPGHGPCQSGRRWGTDGPVASTSRRSRAAQARGPGPEDSDYAPAGAAGRAPGRRRRGRPGPDRIRSRQV